MTHFNYGNNQYPPPSQNPQNPIYPQIYNPANAPPPAHAGQPGFGYPGQNQPYPHQPGFAYPYQPGAPIHPNTVPAAMSYPNVVPTAPQYGYPGQPMVTPTPPFGSAVEWIPTTPRDAGTLSDKAVIAGFEGYDRSPLWVIRARYEGDLIPGKLAIKHHSAYVPWGGKENAVHNIEVCCARPEKIRWVETRDGSIPQNAIIGGNTASGEPLYIGRAREQGSLTPGKVHPSHNAMYISFSGNEIAHKVYEVLCSA